MQPYNAAIDFYAKVNFVPVLQLNESDCINIVFYFGSKP